MATSFLFFHSRRFFAGRAASAKASKPLHPLARIYAHQADARTQIRHRTRSLGSRKSIRLIRTEAEIALRRSRSEPEYRTALSHILLEAERTTSLVEKLLSLARADSGREALEIRLFNLRETVLKVASEWRIVTGPEALCFTEAITTSEVPVEGDEAVLHQLLNILLDNAVKYTPAPGRIDISLHQRDHKAVLTVADSGIGIAEDDQPRIFEPSIARTRPEAGS